MSRVAASIVEAVSFTYEAVDDEAVRVGRKKTSSSSAVYQSANIKSGMAIVPSMSVRMKFAALHIRTRQHNLLPNG